MYPMESLCSRQVIYSGKNLMFGNDVEDKKKFTINIVTFKRHKWPTFWSLLNGSTRNALENWTMFYAFQTLSQAFLKTKTKQT